MTLASLRTARPEDAPALAEIYRPYVTDTVITFEVDPPDASELAHMTHELTEPLREREEA